MLTDQQLLRDYAEGASEAAFAEVVRRHLELVYSAALRMVRDAQLAEDVTQGVFMAVARNARPLSVRPVLSSWLHRTTQNLAANVVRSEVRRRAREQEAAAMNEVVAHESDAVWQHIAPHLDTALGELSEADRDALMLRYFERKSAQEMAEVLGVSDEAAQKRVSRAVERLRAFFAKRGVIVGASALVVVLSANAVQAAPVGLAVTISTTAIAGTTGVATATVATIKTVAMTTLQKVLISATQAADGGRAGRRWHCREEGATHWQRMENWRDLVSDRRKKRSPQDLSGGERTGSWCRTHQNWGGLVCWWKAVRLSRYSTAQQQAGPGWIRERIWSRQTGVAKYKTGFVYSCIPVGPMTLRLFRLVGVRRNARLFAIGFRRPFGIFSIDDRCNAHSELYQRWRFQSC
jgi:RNA polymerase sigma factor (sigma-70 family)